MKKTLLGALLLINAFALPHAAEAANKRYTVGNVLISNVWVRTSASVNTAAYMDINIQGGNTGDKLISAHSNASNKTEIHTHLMENGIARMRQIPSIDIPTTETISLKPHGLHIMLMGLKPEYLKDQKLLDGVIRITLKFEKAGEVEIQAPVVSPEKMRQIMANRDYNKPKAKL